MVDRTRRDPTTESPRPGDRRTDEPRRGNPRTNEAKPGAAAERGRSSFEFRQGNSDESISELLRRLVDQASRLAEQQTELVQAEVRSSVEDLKQSVGAMAGAAVLGIAGLGVLLMGLSFLLGEVMELWLATLIIAAATVGGAYALFLGGQKKLRSSSLSAERSRRTLERAPSAISGNTNEVRSHER